MIANQWIIIVMDIMEFWILVKKHEHQKYKKNIIKLTNKVSLFVNLIHLTDFKYKLNKETQML